MLRLSCFSVCVWSNLKRERERERDEQIMDDGCHSWGKEREREWWVVMLQASIWRGWSVGRLALGSRTAPPAWRGLTKPGHWAGGGLGHWDRFRCRAPALGSVGSGGRWLAGRRRPYGGQVGTLAAARACTCSRSTLMPGLDPPLCQTSFLTPLFFFPHHPPAFFIDPPALLTAIASGEEHKHSKKPFSFFLFPLFLLSSSFWVSHSFLTPQH